MLSSWRDDARPGCRQGARLSELTCTPFTTCYLQHQYYTKFNPTPCSLDAGNQPDRNDAISSTPLPMSRMTRISFNEPAGRRTGSQSPLPERCETANQLLFHPPVLHIALSYRRDGSFSPKTVPRLCQATAEPQYSPRVAYQDRRERNARTRQ